MREEKWQGMTKLIADQRTEPTPLSDSSSDYLQHRLDHL